MINKNEIRRKCLDEYGKRLNSIVFMKPNIIDLTVMDPEGLVKYAKQIDVTLKKAHSIEIPTKECLLVNVEDIKTKLKADATRDQNAKLKELDDKIDSITRDYENKHNRRVESLVSKREELVKQRKEENKETSEFLSKATEFIRDNIDDYNLTSSMSKTFLNFEDMEEDDLVDVITIVNSATKKLKRLGNLNYLYYFLYFPNLVKTNHRIVSAIYFAFLAVLIALYKDAVFAMLSVITVLMLGYKLVFEALNHEALDMAVGISKDRERLLQAYESKIIMSDEIGLVSSQLLELTEFRDDDEILEIIQPYLDESDAIRNSEEYKQIVAEIDAISVEEVIMSPEFDELYESKEQDKIEAINSLMVTNAKVKDRINYLADNFKTIGNYINQSIVYKPMVEDDVIEYAGLKIGSIMKPFTTKPMIFGDNDLMKLYILNCLTNVQQMSMQVKIVDPLYSGKYFADLYNDKLADEITFMYDSILDISKSIREEIRDRVRKCRALSVDDFNENAVITKQIPIKYNVYIVVSDPDPEAVMTDTEFVKLMNESDAYGVYFMFSNEFAEFGNHLEKPVIPKTMKYSQKLADDVEATLLDYKINGSKEILLYKDLLNAYMDGTEMWSKTTLDNIDLLMGYLEGNLTKAIPMQLGECGNVHALIGGESGSGKSVLLDTMMVTALYTHSPEWLQVRFIDFKRNTAASYAGANLAPHFKVISGTKDGEYARSIFEELVNEQTRRQKIFATKQEDKIRSWNKKVLSGQIQGEIMPRILVVFDEYQAMYKGVDPKISDFITTKISQLASEARSVGIHMVMCSQSTDASIPKTVQKQFKLRAALRCDAETSESIIGNNAASELRGFGWVVVNEDKGKRELNKPIRVPFIDNDTKIAMLRSIVEKGVQTNSFKYGTEFFDEEEEIRYNRVGYYYDRFPKMNGVPEVLVLGDLLYYTEKNEPAVAMLKNNDGGNIVITGMHFDQNAMLVQTILNQLTQTGKRTLACTILDQNLGYVSRVTELNYGILAENCNPDLMPSILEALEFAVMSRRKDGWEGKDEIWYLILGAGKHNGIANQEGKEYQRLLNVFKMGPSVGIHVIMVTREPKEIRNFITACDLLITTLLDYDTSITTIQVSSASTLLPGQAIMYVEKTETKKFKIPQCEINKLKGTLKELLA